MPKRISVLLTDDQHQRFVNAKLNLKEKSLQSLMIRATEAVIVGYRDSPEVGTTGLPLPIQVIKRTEPTSPAVPLRDDGSADQFSSKARAILGETIQTLAGLQKSLEGDQRTTSEPKKTGGGGRKKR